VLIGLAAVLTVGTGAARAATVHVYRTGLDAGNNPGTGCDFSLGSVAPGTLPGFELQVTVEVDQALNPPQVISAQVESCVGGVFTNPQPLTGFVLQLDGGFLGSDSVVGSIPLSLLANAATARLAYHALSSDGAEDALFTRDGTAGGDPIIIELPVTASPAPLLSALGMALVALLLFVVGWSRLRRGRYYTASISGALLLVATAVVVYAAIGDPVAVDDLADADPSDTRAEIFAAFTMTTDSELALRLDVEDIPVETVCNDGVDDELDGLTDCEDPDCNQKPCNDGNGCTLSDTCVPSDGTPVCVGTPVDCESIVGNECTVDVCESLGGAPGDGNFKCNSMLDVEKSPFGSCTPEGNCVDPRAADGRCPVGQVIDECLVGRCIELAGNPPTFTCEGEDKVRLLVGEGGCNDGEVCTADGCEDGLCVYLTLDALSCNGGGACTAPCP
jgi:hypothetical protein